MSRTRATAVLAALLVTSTVAVAGPAAAHEDDADPSDGDAHIHEGQGVWYNGGGAEAEVDATCSDANPEDPCTVDAHRETSLKTCWGSFCLF